ncbi:MAG: FAD-dependent oxidoreductase [Candidatus Bathyarchaeota archaeon]|jgi:NADPH-dependent 2,4-dienoyl-CoA reductase/sulfur reductase-like enzyme/rhodanese-related sulfurtransferase
MARRILIIGGVATGPKSAARARRRDPDAEITVIERGSLLSYAGCGMPFYIEGVIEALPELLCTARGLLRDVDYFKSVKDFDVLCSTEAIGINRDSKTVTVKELATDRRYDIPYDKLVLATGAIPMVPRMEGIDFEGVHRLYDPLDARDIREELESGVEKVAIIGGGLIGMEVCGAFAARGCEVTVVEMMDRLVPALLDEDMALLLENHLKKRGVRILKGSRAERLVEDGSGRVAGVVTAGGERVDAEIVVVAIGVRPNVDLAREAGLEIGETGAVKVNEFLQTSDPDIYAGGDCVENICMITGRKVYIPLGSTANKHGRVIGDNITDGRTQFPGITMSTAFKVLNYNVGTTGLNSEEARKQGYDIVTAVVPKRESAHYYPGTQPIIIKLLADRETSKILGAQVIGQGEGIKRIDVVASVLKFGGSVKDLADLDLSYAPPFSTAIDPVAHAANIIRNKIGGLACGIPSPELKEKIDGGGDFVLLDVRSHEEVEERPFGDPRVVHIPLDEARTRVHELPRDREIIAFCKTSVRAYEIQRYLNENGFTDVKFLDGSLDAWPYEL